MPADGNVMRLVDALTALGQQCASTPDGAAALTQAAMEGLGVGAEARGWMRSMLTRAAHVTPPHSTLVTAHTAAGVCIQCEGRPTFRRTLDGRQPTIAFLWYIDCKRASRAAVARLLTPNVGNEGPPKAVPLD